MYIHELNIENIKLENNILLAPMAGITDLPFRTICKKCSNPGLVYTEMVSSKALHYNDKKTETLLNTVGEQRPIAFQIFGSEPEIMGETANKISKDADIIDINMGCPAPKVVKNVVKNTDKPVTVKIRKGWDSKNINAVEIAKIIEEAGASAITIHGRTREEYYSRTCRFRNYKKSKGKYKNTCNRKWGYKNCRRC